MDFQFTAEQTALRHEVRRFLDEELGDDPAERDGFSPEFSKKLARRGWIGIGWPREYGGGGMGPVEQMIFREEFVGADAPVGYHLTAERQVAPSLLLHGSDEQRSEYIPKILNADISFALGLSEPGAGSDLASVATRAVRDGDDYVVNGQKIWTSLAHRADAIWLVTRTNPDAPKHKGISILLLDLKSPGIQVRPLINMADGHGFNEVFFTDVRVPTRNRVGEEDRGWYLLAEHLDFERSGIERIVATRKLFDETLAYVQSLPVNHVVRRRARLALAQLAIELDLGRLLAYRVAWMQSQGLVPNYEASISKMFGTEWQQRMSRTALSIVGLEGAAARDSSSFARRVQRQYLSSVSATIGGGTSEIQRNIIATRGLGLPRS